MRHRLVALILVSWAVIFGPAGVAAAVPRSGEIGAGLERLGWVRYASARLSRERFPVAFPDARSLGAYRNGLARLGVTLFGPSRTGPASLGLEFLFWTRPRGGGFEEELAAAGALMDGIGLPPEARSVSLDLLRRLSRDVAAVGSPFPRAPTLLRAGDLLVHARGRFQGGPGGENGHVLIQFTRGDAPQTLWPTVQEVERLQPRSRFPLFDCNADIMCSPDLSVADLSCGRIGAREWHCRYRLTADDWIGRGRPNRHYADRFRRNAAGDWMLVSRAAERE